MDRSFVEAAVNFKRFVFLLSLGAAGALLIRSFVFEGIYIKTESMSPTLPVGTHIIVNKFAYFFSRPKRGEVVMFHTPQQKDSNKDLVKRVIAIEGDTLEIKKKETYLNGKLLSEPYVQHVSPDVIFEGDNIEPISIPPGHVFVMGDNRDVSGDSRDWRDPMGNWSPYVPIKSIKGRVLGLN